MTPQDTRKGIWLMIFTSVIFAGQDGISRHLAEAYNVWMVVAVAGPDRGACRLCLLSAAGRRAVGPDPGRKGRLAALDGDRGRLCRGADHPAAGLRGRASNPGRWCRWLSALLFASTGC
jgi:hypothetical protein